MTLMLSKEERTLLAKEIVTQEIKYHKLESQKVLRNSREVLEHYRGLKDHISVPMPELSDDQPFSEIDRKLQALAGYRARTEEYVQFIDEVLTKYKQRCMSGTQEQRRKYEVIDQLYLQPKAQTIDALAKRFNSDPSTIRRDVSRATADLKPLLFGVAGLMDMHK
ncbi:hypothetical protein IWT25_02304 [Secundilactobacillus pentosiphilus]|uniref:Uncharacterized protein n=1 Tax=Secundilactobacillus pentosiphilus TaxID=1714682 RepID=A0A1Z5IZ94_9LACO|nr:hypothetical protein [Secundilactobacillus pentosiphilus]GAX06956.1 hypothetical protein IWT25_02304 [Secundilactobacillus pentosiphilus]